MFEWAGDRQECITHITLEGNGSHDDPEFREGYGFGEVVVRIKDGEKVVFSQRHALAGSPDPTTSIATGGIRGDVIELQFHSHERADCGGFSELRINALR